jgi:hypothetical protein
MKPIGTEVTDAEEQKVNLVWAQVQFTKLLSVA